MNRPWQIWSLFALSLVVLLTAMAWVTSTAVRLDRAEWQAGQRAELEERTRLALWRMDSLLAPIIIEESARPFNAYEAFPATARAYTKSFTQIKQGDVLTIDPEANAVTIGGKPLEVTVPGGGHYQVYFRPASADLPRGSGL